jgi:capsule polysaccharide export protein KpsE/RkpR
VAEAERRVAQAEARVQKARLALGAYRNHEALIDPARQAQGALEVANRLIAEQAAAQAQLDQIREATPRNPAIRDAGKDRRDWPRHCRSEWARGRDINRHCVQNGGL